jgi:hypothetical protein
MPLGFEPNLGQTDAQVKFLARGRGYNLFLTPTQAVLALNKPLDSAKTRAVMRMQLVGANASVQPAGQTLLPGMSNNFHGKDPSHWVSGVSHYGQVNFPNIYPGVNLVYYGNNQQQLEFDFVVTPGANPGTIKLAFPGIGTPQIDTKGNLVLSTLGGNVQQMAPTLYQLSNGIRQIVAGKYVLQSGNQVGFQVGAYDPTRPLYIDPVLSYSSYLGGSSDDYGEAIAVDHSGNAYISGLTYSADFPTTGQPTFGGNAEAFITKVSNSGTQLVYSTFLGGQTYGDARDIAVDGGGNAYVTGGTDPEGFPLVNPYQSTSPDNLVSTFVSRLNPAGTLTYSTLLGGSDFESGSGIAVDSAGLIYITGYTRANNFPIVNAYAPYRGGDVNGFLSTLDPSKMGGQQLLYSTYLGGNDPGNSSLQTYSYGIALDNTSKVYVTGQTPSTITSA